MSRTPSTRTVVAMVAVAALATGLIATANAGQDDLQPVTRATPANPTAAAAAPHATMRAPGPAAAAPQRTDWRSPVPLHTKSNRPRMSVTPIDKLEKVDHGIPLPDGTFLPFLNGMTHAPVLQRDPQFGPVPPVVAIGVDQDGFEWWIHADHSATTTRYRELTVAGKTYWDPATEHSVPQKTTKLKQIELPPAGKNH